MSRRLKELGYGEGERGEPSSGICSAYVVRSYKGFELNPGTMHEYTMERDGHFA